LLEAGTYVNANGYKPLHKDSYDGSLAVVNILITAGAKIDTKALYEAMKNGWHLYIVKILLENIGDPNSKDDEEKTTLDLSRMKDAGAVLQEIQKKREEEKAKAEEEAVTKKKADEEARKKQ
jgi:ankyrin repeat protein